MKKHFMTLATGIILLFAVLGSPFRTVAQKVSVEDVVYLSNGSILRGEIVEQTPEKITLKTVGHNILVLSASDIKRISREAMPSKDYFKQSGYYNNTGIDVLLGKGKNTARFQMINGYQFNPNISAGLGIAFVPYRDPLSLIPLFIEGKYRFLRANSSPFLFLKTGYSFSVLSDDNQQIETHKGGLMINPGIGLQFDTVAGFGIYITAGLTIENAQFEQRDWNGRTVTTEIDYRRVQFGAGLSF